MSKHLSAERRDSIMASFARQGLLRRFSARLALLEPGHCRIELPFDDAVAQQHGFFHGGAVGTIADVAGGYAAMTMVEAGRDVLTLESKINFLRPATGATLIARGEVLRAGRRRSHLRGHAAAPPCGRASHRLRSQRFDMVEIPSANAVVTILPFAHQPTFRTGDEAAFDPASGGRARRRA